MSPQLEHLFIIGVTILTIGAAIDLVTSAIKLFREIRRFRTARRHYYDRSIQ